MYNIEINSINCLYCLGIVFIFYSTFKVYDYAMELLVLKISKRKDYKNE